MCAKSKSTVILLSTRTESVHSRRGRFFGTTQKMDKKEKRTQKRRERLKIWKREKEWKREKRARKIGNSRIIK